ncbi:zinc-binding dehydrogenase [Citromicrobium bathyomarinum]|uniref:zinc-binding dehydrogenase n=1 Tax=Citromicrobium bathyomarinum TaxID=72174 RepID=UPI00315AACB1
MTTTGKQIFTTLESDGTLTVEVATSEFAEPKGNQVLVKMEAAPINPSDLALLLGPADLENAEYTDGKIVAKMPEPFNSGAKGRHSQRLPVGNEGAGEVIATGDGDMAKALMGKRVACVPGTAFAQFAIADASMCLPLGDVSAKDGASAFVNPMTALGFVETAKMEGAKAILHTAATSNLGQMLVRICQEDGMPLVNIVRRAEQVHLLQDMGAEHIVNSGEDDFMRQLRESIDETDAFFGFDPIGGGQMVDHCFKAMEQVAVSKMSEFSRYGSNQQKKMYIYGRLDLGPTILTPSYGFGFTLSGWLLTPFLQSAGMETVTRMRQRVLDNITTTFKSNYTKEVTLEGMLEKDAVLQYRQMRTGEKYLVTPHG